MIKSYQNMYNFLTIYLLLISTSNITGEPKSLDLPEIEITSYNDDQLFKDDWEIVDLPLKEFAIVSKHNYTPTLNLTCQAPYKIIWKATGTSIIDKESTLTTAQRLPEVKDDGQLKYTTTISINFKPSLVSRILAIDCEHDTQGNFSRITIFVPGKKALVESGEVVTYNGMGERWVRCVSGNPRVNVTLFTITQSFQDDSRNDIIQPVHDYLFYDPTKGFYLRNPLKGMYMCRAGDKDFVKVIEIKDKVFPIIHLIDAVEPFWTYFDLQNGQLALLPKYKINRVLSLLCSAAYPIYWQRPKTIRTNLNISSFSKNKNNTITYYSLISIQWKNSSFSHIQTLRCKSKSTSNWASIVVFLPGKLALVHSRRTIKYENGSTWVECPIANPNIRTKLYSASENHKYLKEVNNYLQYNPLKGFQLNGTLQGIYICYAGNNDTVRFHPNEGAIGIYSLQGIDSMCEGDNLFNIRISGTSNTILDYEYENGKVLSNTNHFFSLKCNCSHEDIELEVYNSFSNLHLLCMKQETPRNSSIRIQGQVTKMWNSALENTLADFSSNESYYRKITNENNRQLVTWTNVPLVIVVSMLPGESILYTDMNTSFTCKSFDPSEKRKVFPIPLFWVEFKDGTEQRLTQWHAHLLGLPNKVQYSIENRTDPGSIITDWTITIQLTLDIVAVKCQIPTLSHSSYIYFGAERRFQTKVPKPSSLNSTTSETHLTFYVGKTYEKIICLAQGEPAPLYQWKINGTNLSNFTGFQIRNNTDGASVLEFPKIKKSHTGVYSCVATNRFGTDQLSFILIVEDDPAEAKAILTKYITITSISFAFLTALAICGFGIYRYYTAKVLLRGLTDQEIREFFDGNPEAVNIDEIPFSGDVNALPYNDSYEIDENDTTLDYKSVLGSGEFAIVIKGHIKSKNLQVAVKIAKTSADLCLFKSLLSEVKILSYIGNHPNISELVGVTTSGIRKRHIFLYMELCECGSLDKYLENNKLNFVDLIDENQHLKINIHKNSITFEETFTTLNLIRWADQIATGMEYLTYKNIIHADLAARNVLLTKDKTAKVSDFGLSKRLYEFKTYEKKTKGHLPWRWMALESLETLKFSIQSDVWSYGITLWEIFSLGDIPFPNETWDDSFIAMLKTGIRMGKPKFATPEIYSTFMGCWDETPSKRPTFLALQQYFSHLHCSIKGIEDTYSSAVS